MKLFFENMADPNNSVFIDGSDVLEFFNFRSDYVVFLKNGDVEKFPRCVYNFTLFNRPVPF